MSTRQFGAGEIDRHGSISKMGLVEYRIMLYEATQSLLMRCERTFKLKVRGLELANKKSMKGAIIAVARKFAVIMSSDVG